MGVGTEEMKSGIKVDPRLKELTDSLAGYLVGKKKKGADIAEEVQGIMDEVHEQEEAYVPSYWERVTRPLLNTGLSYKNHIRIHRSQEHGGNTHTILKRLGKA